jgi:NAD/NADP transhydrogenase alpha subunit
VFLATLNIVGGFVVTDRMLHMFKSKPVDRARKTAATASEPDTRAGTGGSDGGGGAA